MDAESLVNFLHKACNAIPDHVWRHVIKDNVGLQAHSGGLGRVLMFGRERSMGFCDVDLLALVNIVSLLEICIGNTVLGVGSGTYPLFLIEGMMHPQANMIGVEVVDSRHFIDWVILGGLTPPTSLTWAMTFS